MNKLNVKTGVVIIMIIAAAISRIIPHPNNFTPMMAMALFAGATFSKKTYAYVLPIAAYLLSDLVFAAFGKSGFYGVSQLFVYGAMIIVTALGTTMKQPKVLKVLGYSLTGSAIFWIVSNFGVWFANYIAAGSPTHEAGLSLAMVYTRALPFYNMYSNELFFGAFAGDLFYSAVLFGVFALVKRNYPAVKYSV